MNLYQKMTKNNFIIIIILFFSNIVFQSQSWAMIEIKKIPSNINLRFPDKTLLLNFKTQPDLLIKKPTYSLSIGKKEIPIFNDNKLLKHNNYLNIKTKFKTVISPNKLHEFFVDSSIFQDKNTIPIEINLNKKNKIEFNGKPFDGFEINEKQLILLINKAIEINENNIKVPAKKTFSKVIVHPDLKIQGISEIIAIGKSNFNGSSSARKQNIKAGTKIFNGKIIKKGEIFSFNTILGSVDEKYGFVKELVIKGNENKKELGGGLCQVSTTAFRAAFNGGLPINERRSHSYSVPYYKPFGLDAAIYLGSIDFKFKNDTLGNILIQSFTEGNDLYFIFYGTRDDRQISFEGPFISNYRKAPETQFFETPDLPLGETKIVSNSHAGFQTKWVREIIKNGEKKQDIIISNYRPWPEQILKGIGNEKKM